jgi:hypothetical protein
VPRLFQPSWFTKFPSEIVSGVLFGTPSDPSDATIKQIFRSLHKALTDKRSSIAKALMSCFSKRLLGGEFGSLATLVARVRAGTVADTVGPDNAITRWSSPLFRAVMSFFLQSEQTHSVRGYVSRSNSIPPQLFALAYASASPC